MVPSPAGDAGAKAALKRNFTAGSVANPAGNTGKIIESIVGLAAADAGKIAAGDVALAPADAGGDAVVAITSGVAVTTADAGKEEGGLIIAAAGDAGEVAASIVKEPSADASPIIVGGVTRPWIGDTGPRCKQTEVPTRWFPSRIQISP